MKENSDLDVLKTIGKNIKYIRSCRKVTQEKLAESIDKSAHFISLVERGESGISISTIVDICKALDTDTNALFAGIVTPSDLPKNPIETSFYSFDEKDKAMVTYLIDYINSKNWLT